MGFHRSNARSPTALFDLFMPNYWSEQQSPCASLDSQGALAERGSGESRRRLTHLRGRPPGARETSSGEAGLPGGGH